ncbi:signal peptide peptidase SppA [Dysgonomonas sp. 520]|uniref:signal peptide peptidase SppA n=1 Tax=Dysgonomonas sp. 520 TaxID=2302931 RepID=UPI0013D3DDE2|nr:signal peptide peptidase SppA [Dysgonomonas sp. 520]NDW08531.1 signal peptide peptidase SppA [Dysgonomonas sp. 520]
MRQFFKNVFSTVVGVLVATFLFFLLGILIVSIIVSSSSGSFSLKENTVLELKLEGVLFERTSVKNPLFKMLGVESVTEIGLDDILGSIKKAKSNDKIKGIYIHAGMFSASTASLQEIRNALTDFKESGKFVVAYGDVYTQGCYYLSSMADKVFLNPQGQVDMHGLAAVPTYYKGLFDKLGIEMQIFKVGTFKSAVEPYSSDKMSEPNRQQITAYMGDLWGEMLTGISNSRNISVEQLNIFTDSLVTFQDQKFLIDNRFVDSLLYPSEVKDYLKTMVGIEKDDKLNLASIDNMSFVLLDEIKINTEKPQIAVLYAEGSIVSAETDTDDDRTIVDRDVVKQLEKLKNDDDVKAVVFRVNSRGGSAYASEQIWKAVSEVKAKKPIVVSMGDYAASGGYYISCNANKIVAQPATLTGSIGIFGMFPNVEGLTKKIGLSFDKVKTNRYSDFGDFTRPMRDDEKRLLQAYVERGYDLFLTRCADGRKMPKDSLALIAEGRVWSGKQALKLGLVDELGGLEKAISIAAELAELTDYSTTEYPHKKEFFETILNSNQEELATRALKEYLGADYEIVKTLRELKNQDYMQARMPFEMEVR